jgi:TonB family protein
MIGTDGQTEMGRVLRSVDPRLDTAALEAVLRWGYEPTVVDQRAVAVLMTVTVNFTLQ